MLFLNKNEILESLKHINLLDIIKEGFIAYSNGKAVVPPVGGMEFSSPPGEVHIKYGYLLNQAHYVIKVASGFYDNPKIGLPSSNGLMLVFSIITGELQCVLHDEGYLTDVRTAVAGALAAQLAAPAEVHQIGIIGSGTQAKLQLSYLRYVTSCKKVSVFGRTERSALVFQQEMAMLGFEVRLCQSASEVVQSSNLIVTTTTSRKPLFSSKDVRPGTHITAVGADTPGKQELDPKLFSRASWIIADSIGQCLERGECSSAVNSGDIKADGILEFGRLLPLGRINRSDQDISIVDLTGLAVQDIQVATSVYSKAKQKSTQRLQ